VRKRVIPEGTRYIGQVKDAPLVSVARDGSTEIWCRLEFMNPSGLAKDRIAHYILEKGWQF
jgi:cysteine synthase A